jgi:hypothetical protein
MEKIFLTIDFETVDGEDKWIACALMVATYPSGKIIEIFETSCQRSKEDYNERAKVFWKKNNRAHSFIEKQGMGQSVSDEEKKICENIRRIFDTYPDIYFVSDNPSVDVKIIDQILKRNGYPFTSFRGKKYFQCICTWSFKLGIKSIIGNSLDRLSPIEKRPTSAYFGYHHTPKSDCARILNSHFEVLDSLNQFRDSFIDPRFNFTLQKENKSQYSISKRNNG